jgi:hypothetical protein
MICSAGLSCLCACFHLQVNFFKTADPAMRLRNRVLVIQQFCTTRLLYSPYLELARDRCPRGGWAVLWSLCSLELALAGSSRLLTCIKTQVYIALYFKF